MKQQKHTFVKPKTVSSGKAPRSFDFYVLLFFLISFAGWLWEVGLYLVTEHAWVNRGVYQGPYLPIYGAGGLLLWFLLQKLHRKPFLTFLLSSAICSLLEYATGVFLEWRWGVRWWDYSGHFLNLNGRICLLGAVCFGLGGMLLNCYLLPGYMKLYHRISPGWRMILCGIFLAVFVLDVTYCAANPNMGHGITEQTGSFTEQTGGFAEQTGGFPVSGSRRMTGGKIPGLKKNAVVVK